MLTLGIIRANSILLSLNRIFGAIKFKWIMKKRVLISAMAVLALVSCSSKQQAASEDVVTRERLRVGDGTSGMQLTFPIGDKIDNPAFTGNAYLKPLIAVDSVFNFPQTNGVTFAPGAHSSWHRHGGMVVLVTGGVGLYQEEGRPAQVLRKGDVLQIPAGVRHWHGATKDNWFSQVVIYDTAWRPETQTDEDNSLSDEYYNELAQEEYDHPTLIDSLMFAAPDSMLSLPTFNGPIRLANTVDAPNEADAPGLHYVVFEPGVINAWHTHPGGQILIVTDGIGYHQIEGQPVEELRPGDVVMCPPDVKHWHGASANSRFAHLVAGTNPDKPAVVWTDEMLSKEEYDNLPKE